MHSPFLGNVAILFLLKIAVGFSDRQVYGDMVVAAPLHDNRKIHIPDAVLKLRRCFFAIAEDMERNIYKIWKTVWHDG